MARSSGKKNPFSGIIAGFALLAIGTAVLWLNEADAVANIKAVKDVSKNVIDVASDTVDPANEGQLVCLNGDFIIPDEVVEDSDFRVGAKTAKLARIVEIYQWRETEDADNNYTYDKEWSEELIDSSSFRRSGYDNPTAKPFESAGFFCDKVEIGAFVLSDEQIADLETDETLTPDASSALPQGYKVSENYITNSADPEHPSVGDIRISYEYNDFSAASVLAVQKGNSFDGYVSESGKVINRVDEGNLNSEQVINKMTEENNALKWALRAIGAVAVILGYMSIIGPLSRLASFVPLLGGLVGAVLYLIAGLVGLVHSAIVIAIAWFVFRPVLSIILLAAAAAIVVAVVVLLKKKKKAAPSEAVEAEVMA